MEEEVQEEGDRQKTDEKQERMGSSQWSPISKREVLKITKTTYFIPVVCFFLNMFVPSEDLWKGAPVATKRAQSNGNKWYSQSKVGDSFIEIDLCMTMIN